MNVLLDRWRKNPARELAEALEQALAAVTPNAPPADQSAWQRRARKLGADDLPELAALLSCLVTRRLGDVGERLRAIRKLGPDPRVAAAIAAFMREVPFTSNSSLGLWREVLTTLVAAGDPRAIAWVTEFKANLASTREGFRKLVEPEAARTQQALVAAFPNGVPSLVGVAPAVAAPVKNASSGKARDEATLLAAVYAHPEDDGPRLVLADHLQERGDPRGEFIALQCQPEAQRAASHKRIGELLRKHGKAWLGELAPFITSEVTFSRGFLSRAVLKVKNELEAKKMRALPGWATVEEFIAGRFPVLPSTARALCVVRGATEHWLATLIEAPQARVEELTLSSVSQQELWARFEASEAARSLRRVEGIPFSWMSAPMLAQLTRAIEPASASDGVLDEQQLLAALANPGLEAVLAGSEFRSSAKLTDGRLRVTLDLSLAKRQPGWGDPADEKRLPHIARWTIEATERLAAGIAKSGGKTLVQVLEISRSEREPQLVLPSVATKCVALVREALLGWVAQAEALAFADLRAVGGKVLDRTPKLAKPRAAPPGPPKLEYACELAWCPQGLFVLQEPVLLLEPASGAVLRTFHTTGSAKRLVTANGRWLVALMGTAHVFDLEGGTASRELAGPGGHVTAAALSSDASRALMLVGDIYMDRRCEVIPLGGADGARVQSLFSRRGNDNGTLSPDGRFAVLGRGGSKLEVFAVDDPKARGELLGSFEVDNYTHCAFSPSGKTLAVETQNHELHVFDFEARKERAMFQLASRSKHVCNDHVVAVAGGEGLTLVDLDAGSMRRLLDTPSQSVALSPDGKKLVARIDRALVVLDLSGRELLRLPCSD